MYEQNADDIEAQPNAPNNENELWVFNIYVQVNPVSSIPRRPPTMQRDKPFNRLQDHTDP